MIIRRNKAQDMPLSLDGERFRSAERTSPDSSRSDGLMDTNTVKKEFHAMNANFSIKKPTFLLTYTRMMRNGPLYCAYRAVQVKKIGQGTFGTAFLCRAKGTTLNVVIKRVDIHELPEAERKAAKREAEILSHLNHPCIIRHIESFEEDGHLNIVTEYAEKGDLSSKLDERKGVWLKEEQILDYFVQMCLALHYLHRRKILHRDLKSANVFINSSNEVKLGDFGIARVLKYTMECAKTVVGTPYYLSPEICESKPYNHKSDVWSLGCILYELCCLRHAFEASSITSLVRRILRGKFDPIPSVYSDDLKSLVQAMLQIKPGHRPSISQILNLPAVIPYVQNFAARCAKRGVDTQFMQAVYPPAPPSAGLVPSGRAVASSGCSSSNSTCTAAPIPSRSSSASSRASSHESRQSTPLKPAPSAYEPIACYRTPSPHSKDAAPVLHKPAGGAEHVGVGIRNKERVSVKHDIINAGPAIKPPTRRIEGEPDARPKYVSNAVPGPTATEGAMKRYDPVSVEKSGDAGFRARTPVQISQAEPTPPAKDKYRLSVLRDPEFKIAVVPPMKDVDILVPPSCHLNPEPIPTTSRPRSAIMKAITSARPDTEVPAVKPTVVDLVKQSVAVGGSRIASELLAKADTMLPQDMTHEECKVEAEIFSKTLSQAGRDAESKTDFDESSAAVEHLVLGMTIGATHRAKKAEAAASNLSEAVSRSRRSDKFLYNGKTLKLGKGTTADPLTHRLEALRIFLAGALGEAEFLSAYRKVNAVAQSGRTLDDIAEAAKDVLGKRFQAVTPLMFQLMYCEMLAFAN